MPILVASHARIFGENPHQLQASLNSVHWFEAQEKNTLINVFTDINFLAELCLLYDEFIKKQKAEKLHFIEDTISTKSQQISSPTQTASETR